MRLGGIDVDCNAHFVGHSDADVLLHAITDALLGAAGLEDIGQLFPNTDQSNQGRDSREMLQIAYQKVQQSGFLLVNLDCVIQTEVPKLNPLKLRIRKSIAELLQTTPENIGVKGKTGEGSGDIGQGRLAEAMVVALLVRKTGP